MQFLNTRDEEKKLMIGGEEVSGKVKWITYKRVGNESSIIFNINTSG